MATVPAVLAVAALLAASRGAPPAVCVLLGLAAGVAIASAGSRFVGSLPRKQIRSPPHVIRGGPSPDRISLLDGVVCELRQPLGSIQGFAELLASPAAADLKEGDLRAYRQMMVDTSKAVFVFLAEARDYALLEKGQLRLVETEVDAAELAEAAIRRCRDAAEEADVQLIADLQEEIDITCDVTRFRQALTLLIQHAIRRSPRASMVHMTLRRAATGQLEFILADSGRQMTPVETARSFEPDFAHSGLSAFALPVARRVMLLHSGDVTVSNRSGGGTLARLTLPASRLTRVAEDKGSTAVKAA